MVRQGKEECARGAASQQILAFLDKVKAEVEGKGWHEIKSCMLQCIGLYCGDFRVEIESKTSIRLKSKSRRYFAFLKQACKPGSYASQKLQPTQRLTGVKCKATTLAKLKICCISCATEKKRI